MRLLVFFALVVASLLLVPGAAAGQANQTTNATTYVDDGIRLVEADYDNETGMASIVLESDHPESVTISDGGRLSKGSGQIPSETVLVNGRTRAEVPATNASGRVAVVIDTDDRLYGHLIMNKTADRGSTLIGGPWSGRDVQISAASGAATVALFVITQLIRYRRGTTHDPERLA